MHPKRNLPSPHLLIFKKGKGKKKLEEGHFFSIGHFSSDSGGTLLEPMKSYTVKKNHIDSAVSEILRYRQTQIFAILNNDKVLLMIRTLRKKR